MNNDNIKKKWKEILLVLLALFSISKCTQSCNRSSMIEDIQKDFNNELIYKDSIIQKLNDSCVVLNTTIKVYEERVNGIQRSLDIQKEAAQRIAEAKKNISVNVKNVKNK